MDKIRIVWSYFVSCLVALGLVLEISAQTPGAYKLVPNDDAECLAAAKFAIREEAQKVGKTIAFASMVFAQRQAVAGTNYKLCLKVKVNGISKRAEAVVFRNPQKEYTLNGWRWGECSKPAELRSTTASPASEKP